MTYLVMALIVSGLLNILLIWYVIRVLSKLLYTSDNMGDLYVAFRMYENFITSLYEMEMFYGEPIIQELIEKTKLLREEIERFESIYNLTTDVELIEEEMLSDGNQEETQEAH
jgi:hypothetical protein